MFQRGLLSSQNLLHSNFQSRWRNFHTSPKLNVKSRYRWALRPDLRPVVITKVEDPVERKKAVDENSRWYQKVDPDLLEQI